MPSNLSGADLEALTQLQRQLQREAGALRGLTSAATAGTAALERVWEGPDSAQFRRQWMTVHRRKLTSAVDEIMAAADTIERNRQAQEQTSASDGAGGGAGPGGGSGFDPGFNGDQPPLVPFQGGDGEFVADNELSANDVPQGDPDETGLEPVDSEDVFDEEYMEAHIGRHNEGENDPELNRLMNELLNDDGSDPAALDARLEEIAAIRGVDADEFKAQHEVYLQLAEQRGPIDDLENLDTEFLGTTTSLRYGNVVGDVLGVDPVFAALLNPSGGQVGGANRSYTPGDNDAIGYHGTFHDAAGYLYNNHNETGPGYDYLGREMFLDTGSPNTGQVTGISWWAGNHPQLDSDASQVADVIWDDPPGWAPVAVETLHRLGFEEGVGQITHFAEGGVDIYQGLGEIRDGNFTDGLDQIYTGGENIVVGTADNIWDLGNKYWENVNDGVDLAVDAGEYVYDRTVDAGEYVYDRTVDAGEYVYDRAVDAGGEVVDFATDTGGDVIDFATDTGGDIIDVVTNPIDTITGLGGLLG